MAFLIEPTYCYFIFWHQMQISSLHMFLGNFLYSLQNLQCYLYVGRFRKSWCWDINHWLLRSVERVGMIQNGQSMLQLLPNIHAVAGMIREKCTCT